MAGGKSNAIELGSRVFVRCLEKDGKTYRIWVGRVQKMGRRVGKKTYEYHNPVHLEHIPDGGFVYCHWYGKFDRTDNKWYYGVADARSMKMSNIRGVLSQRLTPSKRPNPRKTMYKDALELCPKDLATYNQLDEKELGNKKLFP